MPKKLSRRGFLMGCSAAIAAMAGARLSHVAFGAPNAAADILLVVFLRGAWDALNVVLPIDGPDRALYEAARPNLKIPASGTGAALPLSAQFGLHPAMASLHTLYQAQKLAIVQAVGMNSDTRSHFDAMQYMELGTPGAKNTASGWLTRLLQTGPTSSALIPALAAGSSQPTSLLADNTAVAMGRPSDFRLNGYWRYVDDQRTALRHMYAGEHWLHQAGLQTLNATDIVEGAAPGSYTPANGAVYPNGSFGDNLKAIAQMIKMDVGLQVATVDFGGWDTHEYQGDNSGGYLGNTQLKPLSNGLAAFYTDLDPTYTNRLTVVVMSEFGRRLRENSNHGTDHGHGSAMLVLGGNVNGGQLYGTWPGLASEQLYDQADLAVTTDYRQILSEIVVRRMNNPFVSQIFPNYTYANPLGVVQGADVVTRSLYLPLIQR